MKKETMKNIIQSVRIKINKFEATPVYPEVA